MTYKGERYSVHSLAWLIVNGEWPDQIIDHVNGLPWDNRIENLRLTDDRLNALNKDEHRGGSLAGTRYNRSSRCWEARIKIKGRKIHLGSYKTKEEASARYFDAVMEVERLDNELVARFLEWVAPRPIGRPIHP